MPINEIAQLLDLGFTGGLIAAVVALWIELKANRAELVSILKEIAGLKAKAIAQEMPQKFMTVWLDKHGHRCGQGMTGEEFRLYLKANPKAYQYHVNVANCAYSLATTDTALMGLEYGQACELALYLEIPF
jgi:hypothetical protein